MMITLAYILYWAGSLLDIDSTQQVIKAGGIEKNPLLGKSPSILKMLGFKAATFALLLYMGSPWWMFVMGGVAYAALAVRNYKLAKELKKE